MADADTGGRSRAPSINLARRAARLVTKDELFAAVWGAAYVSDAALAVCIRELRQGLGDAAQTPQYVETVRGRGYRFIALVTTAPLSSVGPEAGPRRTEVVGPSTLLVGREAALAQLWQERYASSPSSRKSFV